MDEKLNTMHELCETLMRELDECNEKIRMAGGKLSAGDIDYVDKLTHAIKSIKTTIAMMEADDGYSERYMPRYMYNDGRSYAKGGRKRDSMGRYSRENRGGYSREYSREGGYSYADGMDAVLDEMRGMMADLPADKQREVRQFIDKMER